MKRLTIKDVATLAGVSPRTVSRVINDSINVNEATREKVQKIINDTGYEVNILAKGLKQQKTNAIIVFIDEHQGGYWSIWHNEIVNKIIFEAKKKNYRTIISASTARESVYTAIDGFSLLKNGFADGAILFDSVENDYRIKYLREREIPFVIIGKDIENRDTSFVDCDNYKVGYIGAEFIMNKGYKNAHFLLGEIDFLVNKTRAEGFKDAYKEHLDSRIDQNIHYGISDFRDCYNSTKKILESNKVDALFISGDERVLGAYRAIEELGLKIGRDIAVLGIDNIQMSEYFSPPVTTIDQPKEKFAKYSVSILCEMMNSDIGITKRILLKPKVIERKSM